MTTESSSIELNQSFSENMDTDLNEDGSNTIILPQEKKNKGNGAGKALGKSKAKEPQKMSKTKERKLKQIQEEKAKRLLLSRSIEVLQKHKIWDGAYSLMKCPGTIGQRETMREKRRRAVEFSKAGLQVPKEILLLKRKRKEKAFEVTEEDVGSHPVHPSLQVTNNNAHTCMMEGAESHSTPCDSDERLDTNSQCLQPGVSDIVHQNNVLPPDAMFMDCMTTPIIVHVSRPKEVEETRRDLPIVMMEQEIMEAINEHPVVIICGETGCGKTTQVPQFLYEAGFGSKDHSDRKGMIGVTQPRRVAVLATAKRMAFELGLHLVKEVGFQVRHDKMIESSCSIKFMTDGILLREVQNDFLLRQYSVLILDDVHERSLNTDILIGMLSRVIRLRQKIYMEQQEKLMSGVRVKITPENIIMPLRLVLMSATLRVEDFISDMKLFTDSPPVLKVAVRQYPVTVHFSKETKVDYLSQAFKKVLTIHQMFPPGGIFVFVTGQVEVEFLFGDDEGPCDVEMDCYSSDLELESESEAEDEDVVGIESPETAARSGSALHVLPLYAMLPTNAQLSVFVDVPEVKRLVVVATNVAESSLTIPGIKYVVDSGKEKVKNYIYTSGMTVYEVQWISKASAVQCEGRAGRTGPGHCYRLYSYAAFVRMRYFPSSPVHQYPRLHLMVLCFS